LIFFLKMSNAAEYGREKPWLSSNLGAARRSAAFGAAGDQFAARLRRGAEIVAAFRAATGASEATTARAAAEEEGEAGEGPGGGAKDQQPAGERGIAIDAPDVWLMDCIGPPTNFKNCPTRAYGDAPIRSRHGVMQSV
jgi:hypothetical protein